MLESFNFTTSEFLLVMAFFVALGAKIIIDILVPIEQAEVQLAYQRELLRRLEELEREEGGR